MQQDLYLHSNAHLPLKIKCVSYPYPTNKYSPLIYSLVIWTKHLIRGWFSYSYFISNHLFSCTTLVPCLKLIILRVQPDKKMCCFCYNLLRKQSFITFAISTSIVPHLREISHSLISSSSNPLSSHSCVEIGYILLLFAPGQPDWIILFHWNGYHILTLIG